MEKHSIVCLPGDGIGKVVLKEAIRVLDAAGFEADYVEGDIGWEFWRTEGNPLPQRTLDLIAKHKIGLFGAITSKPKDEAFEELAPELQEKGLVYSSPIVGLRQYFGLDICLRPCRTYTGNPLNFIRRGANGTIEEPEVDVAIFRQNTEGLYGGVEWSNPPSQVYDALMTHPKFSQNFGDAPVEEVSVSTRIFTKKYTERIVRAAFEHAKQYNYKSVTVCEKPNVIRETSGMMYKMAQLIQKADFPGIELWNTNIDAQMMWLTKNPENYGVIVAGNMFGDIVSDGFAGLIGGLGFACSAQYNPETGIGVFEPTHGSAPKYADYPVSIVNPIAMVESACMMLDFVDEQNIAGNIRKAIAEVVVEGKVQTYDMAKMSGKADVVEKGAASTAQMADAIIDKL
ncbi:MAG TPA: isocitrate/isopropylmalate family dehydrogenase [Candidatus Marinimicrobia bacterium]|jgi:3-isopropylmalate dehydrogenase|nr:3-isopropylmalate dehydrogenase [Candidatus Neomarinimicrobiota bacterium]MDP6143299.1 isocitrate/isopropylmalate family dehydrogenase [Candidatus Neomarinimicrobiota bacterium]MDP6260621.1 isocitrate/isopropylmalate family dehydrogenase [Candidatus Neomarinimicrobiota bacterium]MDP7127405.1 isocitrate/isopropylmalate family dehydrogenase [Candidatus Neomarinimicrobiota bacterium]MDP7337351.1 isocitrate/isopropylmalate family dehydrogenase [Candidatus Neomarinimicrobiota bacterium]|tara:strand:+ start:3381 stop:4577 length:1197 start_codon:yes stop_codon:yes gene_type:complete